MPAAVVERECGYGRCGTRPDDKDARPPARHGGRDQHSGCVGPPSFDISTLYWTGPGLFATFTK